MHHWFFCFMFVSQNQNRCNKMIVINHYKDDNPCHRCTHDFFVLSLCLCSQNQKRCNQIIVINHYKADNPCHRCRASWPPCKHSCSRKRQRRRRRRRGNIWIFQIDKCGIMKYILAKRLKYKSSTGGWEEENLLLIYYLFLVL